MMNEITNYHNNDLNQTLIQLKNLIDLYLSSENPSILNEIVYMSCNIPNNMKTVLHDVTPLNL